ncbi:hypothetical protein M513_01459 [Trichuris suis]|uniref:AH domain-containing protein n=1 Tax=Trichuris suis TaxID=68888 RepID=A0A085MKP3_9BILA|nr:hypothetical protein M513_01459 [Trichuris suis]
MAPGASVQQLPPKELALFKRIVKCYEHKQYRNGLKFAKQILSNPKFAEHGETLAMKGLILNCLGKKEEANEYVKRGLTNDVRSHVCWHVYGLMQRSEKKYDEAIKAYRNALKIEKENIQILRDLSLLQLQMRDLEGYKDTRYQLFILRPTQRVSWIGFALGLHLVEEYDLALSILEEFRKTQTNKTYDFEHSEFLLYQNMVYREAGRLDEALAHLERFQAEICDQLSYLETKADLLYQLGKKEDSALIYRKLLAKNSENVFYYKRLEECLGITDCTSEEAVARRIEMYDEIAKNLPRSLAASRLPLAFVPESSFVPRLAPLLIKMLRKGAAPVFTFFRFLYDDPVKVALIEQLTLSYRESLEKEFRFPGENEVEAPSTILWVYYYLALHYDYLNNFQEALQYVNKGLEHTPTLIELYTLKARIYKHAGNRKEAVRWIEEAQSLDTADRYVNSKCAKYMLQAGMITEAIIICSKFTREGVQTVDSLNDMQCMWFETECARAFRKMGQFGEALKKCHEIDRHFTDIIEDQFDFHTYCFRRMTLCAYVRLLRLEDLLRKHDFFFKAAKCAIKIYLRLYDAPHEATADMDGYSQNSATSRELRKQFRKQRKKAAKAEMERQKTQQRPQTAKLKQEAEVEESHRPVFDPAALAKTEKPLEDALLFLNPLIQLNCNKLAAYVLGFEVYYRRGKVLLMLLCLRKAEKIDPQSPQLHWCKVKFFKYIREHPIEGIVSEIVNEAYAEIRDCVDLKSYNLAYYKEHQVSLPHRLAVAEVMHFLDESEHAKAVEIATDLKSNLQGVSWKAALMPSTVLFRVPVRPWFIIAFFCPAMPTGRHSLESQLVDVSKQSTTIPTTSLVDVQLPSENSERGVDSVAQPRTYDAVRNGNGYGQIANAQHKLEALKTWGISAYKCTKQAIAERLGKVPSSRTVDADIEGKMSLLRELQQRYNRLLLLTKALIGHLRHVQYTQIQLAEQLAQLAVRERDLQSDFLQNAQLLKCTSENCEHLLAALHFFTSSMNTLCNTTIEDTMVTVRQFESARLEYDAYRTELDMLKRSATRPPDFIAKLSEAENACTKYQQKYEQLRSDVETKLSLLSANKVRVLKKQMQLFNGALVAYYSGNQKGLEAVLRQFSVRSAQNNRLNMEEH